MDFVNNAMVVSGGYGRIRENHSRRLAVGVSGTYFLNSHTIKVGLAYEDNFVDDRTVNKGGPNGEYPNPIIHFLWGDPLLNSTRPGGLRNT